MGRPGAGWTNTRPHRKAGRRSPPQACSEKGVAVQVLGAQGGGQRNGQDLTPTPDRGEALGAGCWGLWEGGRGAGGCLQMLGPSRTPRSPPIEQEGPAVHSLGPAVGPRTAVGPPAPGGRSRGACTTAGEAPAASLQLPGWPGQSQGRGAADAGTSSDGAAGVGTSCAPPQVSASPSPALATFPVT